MNGKKGFQVYHLVLCEGYTEFNLFAYLIKVRFKEVFAGSDVQFSNKVEIINENGEQAVSQGKLGGISNFKHFKSKHVLIQNKYVGQKLFYFLDKDIEDSSKIGALITKDKHLVQFIKYNSEYLLLKLAGKNPKKPSNFVNLKNFRDYCKVEFELQFGKKAHEFKDVDFELALNNSTDDEIKHNLKELFATLK